MANRFFFFFFFNRLLNGLVPSTVEISVSEMEEDRVSLEALEPLGRGEEGT